MFLHGGFTHILFNMLGLYFFGSRVENQLGTRRFTSLYFLSGVSGALLSCLLAPNAPIIGASAGVYGVMLAFAYYWPHEPIYIYGVLPVPARIMVILTTLLTLWSGFSGAGGGIAHFAHLGGYVGAFLYLRWIGRQKGAFKRQIAATAPKPAQIGNYKNIDRSGIHELNRVEVDRILDKINAQGIDALTPQERLFLSNFVPLDDRKPPVS
jgi:membrane associated rhomboid family serine protease